MRQGRRSTAIAIVLIGAIAIAGVVGVVLIMLITQVAQTSPCGAPAAAGSIALAPAGGGRLVGATEYGGPGDPSSGITGARGDNLLEHPDTYAELGGLTWDTATAMGGLPYMTPLRITFSDHSAIAYKRDFGLGGGPIDGLPRVIDLWWEFAGHLGIPYENGLWSGPVRVARPPATGAGNVLGQSGQASSLLTPAAPASDPAACSDF
jgi:hypothetical protein